jgi:hypothetical protein
MDGIQGQGTAAEPCENDNENSGSIKFREFLDKLRNMWLLQDSDLWKEGNKNYVINKMKAIYELR